jgi:glycosyltransferase involved in cell wall biosynthesis
VTLTVLNIAYPLAPVSRDAVGGAEQVLFQIDSELVRRGYRSIVIACEDSVVEGELIAIKQFNGVLTERVKKLAHRLMKKAITSVIEDNVINLIHMHGIDFIEYMPQANIPKLVTLHLPLNWYPPKTLLNENPNLYFNCVSYSQQRTAPLNLKSMFAPILNGVNIQPVSNSSKDRFAMVMGRICPEKGFHLAIEASRKAQIPLLIAGKIFPFPAHQKYFESQIIPFLDRNRKFIGAIGFEKKRRLLTLACCLLIPSLVAETSSLVAMEALLCGTPVIAFRSGALVEIVEDGVTGFLVRNVDEMADALTRVNTLSSNVCREVAKRRFSSDRMTQEYLEVYEKIVNRTAPHNDLSENANTSGSIV